MTDYVVTAEGQPNSVLTFGTTYYVMPVGGAAVNAATSEAIGQVKVKASATARKVRTYVSANSLNGNTTFTSRVNGADGNMTFTVTSASTGWFEDAANSDSLSADDLFCWKVATGGSSGSFDIEAINIDFVTPTNPRMIWVALSTGLGIANASATRFLPGRGILNNQSSELSAWEHDIVTACTARNMRLYVSSNTRTTDTTFSTYIEGGDGNQSITVAGSGTGWFEDTSNTDSISANTRLNYKFVTGTGTGTITVTLIGCDLVFPSDKYNVCERSGGTIGGGTTRYLDLWGNRSSMNSTIGNAETSLRSDITIGKVGCFLTSNAGTSDCTVTLLKNGSSTSCTFTIPASTTGWFSDTSNTATATDGDELTLEFVRAAGTGNTTPLITVAEITADTDGAAATAYAGIGLHFIELGSASGDIGSGLHGIEKGICT